MRTPRFRSEAEEAEWWDTHSAEAVDMMRRAEKRGAVTHGEMARVLTSPTKITTIRLPEATIEKARVLAARKGLRYQTYLRMIIHEHIAEAEKAG